MKVPPVLRRKVNGIRRSSKLYLSCLFSQKLEFDLSGLNRAPTFVSKSTNETTVPEAELPIARPDDEDATAGSEASDDHDEIAERGPPRTRENSYSDDEPTAGAGIGLGASKGSGIGSMPTRGGFGGGIGSSRGRGSGGIGSARTGPSIGGGGIGAGIGSPASKPFGMSSFAKSSGTEAEQAKERQVSGETQGTSSRPEPYTRISNDNLGGIGTAKRHEIEEAEEEALYPSDPAHAMPQSFGSQRPSTPQPTKPNRAQKAFTVKNEATPSNKPKLSVTSRDLNHLTSISSSFGARMLAKQGWAPGKGLGKDEDGKAVPIEANVGLARGQGIGKGVRTEQSRREAKERGELEEGSSDEERKARKKKKERQKEAAPGKGPSAAWKRERKVKVKTQHKTYDELVAEAAENGIAASSGVGLVLDARSGELKEVSSLAELSLSARAQTEWTPTGDKMQLPELRHNLRLILDSTKGDVQALIKESQSVRMRREWAKREVQRLRVEDGTELKKTQRLREVHEIANQVATLVQQVNNSRGDPLESMKDQFNRLVDEYKDEYKEYDLDEVVIGAMSQTVSGRQNSKRF
jgi:tuftelin-interacting protein 11